MDGQHGWWIIVAHADQCLVTPPPTGTVLVELVWDGTPKELPGWHLRPTTEGLIPTAGGTRLELKPGDTRMRLDVLTAELPANGLWLVQGTVTVAAKWDPGTNEWQDIGDPLIVEVGVDGLIGRQPSLDCSAPGPIHSTDGGSRRIVLKASGDEDCRLAAPETGDQRRQNK